MIDLDQCPEYNDVPKYNKISIKDEYEKSQKLINVNAKVRVISSRNKKSVLVTILIIYESFISSNLGYGTLYLYKIFTILG